MTRLQLKQYVLRKLGEPVINVEIDDLQMEGLIDEAMQLFTENHYDGCDIAFYSLTLTTSTNTYTLPATIQEVIDVLNPSNYIAADDETELIPDFQQGLDNVMYSDFITLNYNFKMAQQTYTGDVQYDFNSTSKRFYLFTNPENYTYPYILRVYTSPSNYEDIYNNLWLKKYMVALAKVQWGMNLSKYVGGVLPGGASINGERIMDEGKLERDALEIELREKYTLPPDFEMA